jgi:CYTH domain-containing protein
MNKATNLEIERKFLVNGSVPQSILDECKKEENWCTITQGYISVSGESSIRIRTIESVHSGYDENDEFKEFDFLQRAYLTAKSGKGAVKTEIETEIDYHKATDLLANFAISNLIKKNRYKYTMKTAVGPIVLEIDEFLDKFEGLWIVEIEFADDVYATGPMPFDLPVWVGEEVTNDPKYLNVSLSFA